MKNFWNSNNNMDIVEFPTAIKMDYFLVRGSKVRGNNTNMDKWKMIGEIC
jgi:hypothetical protein